MPTYALDPGCCCGGVCPSPPCSWPHDDTYCLTLTDVSAFAWASTVTVSLLGAVFDEATCTISWGGFCEITSGVSVGVSVIYDLNTGTAGVSLAWSYPGAVIYNVTLSLDHLSCPDLIFGGGASSGSEVTVGGGTITHAACADGCCCPA